MLSLAGKEDLLQQINPYLTESATHSIEHLVAASLMLVTRSGHISNMIALTQVRCIVPKH